MPPGGPQSVEDIRNGISYLILTYVTPGAVVTYSPELLQGLAWQGTPWQNISDAQLFGALLAKITLPVFTAWTLKKARNTH